MACWTDKFRAASWRCPCAETMEQITVIIGERRLDMHLNDKIVRAVADSCALCQTNESHICLPKYFRIELKNATCELDHTMEYFNNTDQLLERFGKYYWDLLGETEIKLRRVINDAANAGAISLRPLAKSAYLYLKSHAPLLCRYTLFDFTYGEDHIIAAPRICPNTQILIHVRSRASCFNKYALDALENRMRLLQSRIEN